MTGANSTNDSLNAPVPWHAADAVSPSTAPENLAQLPAYTRSLLRIELPVVVTLATTTLPVKRVMEMGPGTIVHFDKSYDSPLTLSVGHCEVAVGDAVKVGDKFGLRISSMVMPQEKFEPIKPQA